MTELLERLAAQDPAATLGDYDESTMKALIDRATEGQQARPPGLGWARVAVAAVAIVLVGALVWSQSIVGSPTLAAAEVLTKAAAEIGADPVSHGDQYWRIDRKGFTYNTSQQGSGPITTWKVPFHETEFVSVDGKRPNWHGYGYPSPATALGGPATDDAPGNGKSTQDFFVGDLADADLPASWQLPTPAYLAALPLDPVALRAFIADQATKEGVDADAAIFATVTRLLNSGRAPAALRRSLLAVASATPNLVLDPNAAAADGSPALAIGSALPGSPVTPALSMQVLISKATGQVVGTRQVTLAEFNGVPAGTVVDNSTTTRNLVDAIPAAVDASAERMHCVIETKDNVNLMACRPA